MSLFEYDEDKAKRALIKALRLKHTGEDNDEAFQEMEQLFALAYRLWPDLKGYQESWLEVDGKRYDATTGALLAPPRSYAPGTIEESELKRLVRVVGIGGCTRSGKGTLARRLVKSSLHIYPTIVCCDRFWKPRGLTTSDSTGRVHQNWEDPEAVDEETIYANLHKIRLEAFHNSGGKKMLVVIEGFLLYSLPSILPFLDFRLYLTIDRLTCCYRRVNSTFVPKDYFNDILWPNFLKHNKSITSVQNIFVIDGTKTPEEIFSLSCNILTGVRSPLSANNVHEKNLQPNFASLDAIYADFQKRRYGK